MVVALDEMSDPAPQGFVFDDEGRFTEVKAYKCRWEDRFSMVSQLKGGPVRLSNGSTGFRLPHRHPDFPSAYVRSTSCKPFGKPSPVAGGFIEYPHAIVYATYRTSDEFGDDQDESTPFLRERIRGYAETINLPGQFFWNAIAAGVQENPLPQAVAPARRIPGATWQIKWLSLTSLPLAFLNLIGKCNDAQITSRRYGVSFDAETLLYGEPEIEATFNTDGSYALSAALSLNYKPTGWNLFFGKPGDEANANPIYAQGSATAFKPVTPGDFSPLYNLG